MAEDREGNGASHAAISKIPGTEKYLYKDKKCSHQNSLLNTLFVPSTAKLCRNEVPVHEWISGPAHWSPVFPNSFLSLDFVPLCLNQWLFGCLEIMDKIKHFLWLTQDQTFASLQYNWYNGFCKRDQWLSSILFLQNVNDMNDIKSNWSKQK